MNELKELETELKRLPMTQYEYQANIARLLAIQRYIAQLEVKLKDANKPAL